MKIAVKRINVWSAFKFGLIYSWTNGYFGDPRPVKVEQDQTGKTKNPSP